MQLVELDREPASAAFLVTGVPGCGKTTVSVELARRFPAAAHISSDLIGSMIVAGRVAPHTPHSDCLPPGAEDGGEADRQLLLHARNASLLCDSFFRAGFTPVVDDVVVRKLQLDHYLAHLRSRPLVLVVLVPRHDIVRARDAGRAPHKRGLAEQWLFLEEALHAELAGVGIWMDTSDQSPAQTVDTILAATRRAREDPASGQILW
jgi:predicted kinase